MKNACAAVVAVVTLNAPLATAIGVAGRERRGGVECRERVTGVQVRDKGRLVCEGGRGRDGTASPAMAAMGARTNSGTMIDRHLYLLWHPRQAGGWTAPPPPGGTASLAAPGNGRYPAERERPALRAVPARGPRIHR